MGRGAEVGLVAPVLPPPARIGVSSDPSQIAFLLPPTPRQMPKMLPPRLPPTVAGSHRNFELGKYRKCSPLLPAISKNSTPFGPKSPPKSPNR